MKYLFLSLAILFLPGCFSSRVPKEPSMISIQVIDKNGLCETISSKDRLSRYENMDFLEPQPYQKVLRVYNRTEHGKFPSVITSYHNNGHIWQYLEVLDGRAHGTYKEWYPNGLLKMHLSIIEGIADLSESAHVSWIFEGENQIWDAQGHLEAKIFYQAGDLHGSSTYYYPSGKIKKILPYENNHLQGETIFYFENGSIMEKISYEKDKRQGIAEAFSQEGDILYQEIWEEDLLLEGKYLCQGKPYPYSISRGNGHKVEFCDDVLLQTVEYKNGIPQGAVQCFDENGSVTSIYHQLEGKKQGEEVLFYPLTENNPYKQIKLQLYWHEDMLQGTVKTWFPNGIQESERKIYQNKKNGTALAWYKDGSLMLSEEYENDLLIQGSYYKKGQNYPVSRVSKKKGIATLYDSEGFFLKKVSYDKGLPILDDEE